MLGRLKECLLLDLLSCMRNSRLLGLSCRLLSVWLLPSLRLLSVSDVCAERIDEIFFKDSSMSCVDCVIENVHVVGSKHWLILVNWGLAFTHDERSVDLAVSLLALWLWFGAWGLVAVEGSVTIHEAAVKALIVKGIDSWVVESSTTRSLRVEADGERSWRHIADAHRSA